MAVFLVIWIACLFKGSSGDSYVNVSRTGCLNFEFNVNLHTTTVSITKDSVSVMISVFTSADTDDILAIANEDYKKRITNFIIDRPQGTVSFCLVNTSFHDGGEYICDAGIKDNIITLYVLDMPSQPVISVLKNGTIASDNGMLSCLSVSISIPPGLPIICTWFVNNTKLKNDSKYQCNRKDTCNELIIIVDRNDKFNDYTCFATEQYGQTSNFSDVKKINPKYFPNIHMKPIVNPYILYYKQKNIILTCFVDDANPADAVTYEWNSPSGAFKTQTLTISTVNKSHSGEYSCTATNVAGTSNITTKQIHVQYGPLISNITNPQVIIEGNNLKVSPKIDASPAATFVWWTKQNDDNFIFDGSILEINTIQKTSIGNYSCNVMNTLTPSGMTEINMTTQKTFFVNVQFKPVLCHTRPYSPQHISATINQTLQITITITANPAPTVDWSFKAEAECNPYNLSKIFSNKTTNGFLTSSSILIDNVQSHNFGDYTFTAKNTVGLFYRRFVVMKKASLRQEMCVCTNENNSMFVAGIATLAVGLFSLMSAVVFTVWHSFKKKAIKSSKSDEYTESKRSNPAFTDAYSTLQPDIESTPPIGQGDSTYEEFGRKPEVHAYNTVETIQPEPRQPQEQDINTYEEYGRTFESHAYADLEK